MYFRAEDHQGVSPAPILQGKSKADMKGPEDFFEVVGVVPGEQLMEPLERDRLPYALVDSGLTGRCCFVRNRQAGCQLMPSTALLLSQAFSGFAFGSLLALMSSGLTIILVPWGFVNFAHGAMFMLGAYAAFVVLVYWHSYIAALLAGAAVLLVVSVVLERGLLRFYYTRPPEDQLLVTFGLSVMLVEAVRYFFGSDRASAYRHRPGATGSSTFGGCSTIRCTVSKSSASPRCSCSRSICYCIIPRWG